MNVALVCIAKNEDNYIEEWVNYNLKLGFDKIFIYQNNWRTSLENDSVEKIEFDGDRMQDLAYNNFLRTRSDEYDWVAFFDVDEFLVLKKHKNIKDFIEDYKDYNGIGINWVLFGDNNLTFDGNYSVLERFTKRQTGINQHIKSIVKADKNFLIQGVHNPVNVSLIDTDLRVFNGPFNPFGKDDVAQLNHYFCKTRTEWEQKRNRGRADVSVSSVGHIRSDSDFYSHNLNEIEDTNALEFYLS